VDANGSIRSDLVWTPLKYGSATATSEGVRELDVPAARAVSSVSEAYQMTKPGVIREIAIQLPGTDSHPVDLHITDTRGKVHVEVRTDNGQLASSLRDHVGDLVERLDASGYRMQPAEIREEAKLAAVAALAESNSTRDQARHVEREQPPGRDGGSHPGQQQQQQGHPRGNRPRWLEEIRKDFQAMENRQENNHGNL
jgi:hypothetical protein